MSLDETERVFRQAIRNWSDGNLDGVVALLADDIVHNVNVDALQIPWVSSTVGKAEVCGRLKLIMDTFVINAFVVESLVREKTHIRAVVLGYHTHRRTGERLDVKLRFRARVANGLIVQLDEFLDAAYIEAFERFVKYLEQTAQEAAAGQP